MNLDAIVAGLVLLGGCDSSTDTPLNVVDGGVCCPMTPVDAGNAERCYRIGGWAPSLEECNPQVLCEICGECFEPIASASGCDEGFLAIYDPGIGDAGPSETPPCCY